ncbi:MAG: hypothetical protein GF313_16045 [Caldithrix sp.]|nr:hypothetical protein [Caldithrix sp.]
MKLAFKTTSIMLVWIIMMSQWACERKTSPMNPNDAPNTTIANIPVDSSTIFAMATLHWDGEDTDGFIKGYEYRYTTFHMLQGDTYEQDWLETNETSLTIAFESSDSINMQSFEVRAVDNNGAVDPTPAKKVFFTPKTHEPETEILYPRNNSVHFARETATDWWPGVQIAFTAEDEDGDVAEYAWAVDDGEWNWTTDTTLYIAPENFVPLADEHLIKVTSRDNTNLIDPQGHSIKINLIEPTFEKDILIIDETVESLIPGENKPSDSEVDQFYADIFGTDESWDFQKDGMPSKEIMGQYKMIIWHADNPYSTTSDVHKLPVHINDIKDYMNVGGDFVMSGWRILKSFANEDDFPRAFREGEFIHDYLHITLVDETALFGDFIGAEGTGGFSDIAVDSTKMEVFPYAGKLAQINLMPGIAGFTDKMYIYRNDISSSFTEYRGKTVGLRYYGSVFDAVVLGFPVYFIQKDDAMTMASEILSNMGYK